MSAKSPRRTIFVLIVLASILIFQGHPTPLVAQAISGPRIPLPAVDVSDDWTTRIHVQNVGEEPAVAVVELYAAPESDEPPEEATVVGVRCSDPIPPGHDRTLELAGGTELDAARSGFVYAVAPGRENAICGGDGTRQPAGPVAVVVSRQQTDETGAAHTSAYAASPNQAEIDEELAKLNHPDYVFYVYFAPLVTAEWAGGDQNRRLVLQNVGDEATSELYVQYFPQGGCEWAYPAARVAQPNMAPGQARRLDLQDVEYPTPPFRGTAVIRSDQPLAVVVDQRDVKLGTRASYAASYKPAQALTNYAPLVAKSFDGWEAGVQIQDASPFLNARASIYYLDAAGEPLIRDFEWICYVDAWRVSPQSLAEVPADWVGALRIESDDWWTMFGFEVPAGLYIPTPLSVVNLTNAGSRQALSYTGLPAPEVGAHTVALRRAQDVALPWVVKHYGSETSLRSSRIAVQNLSAELGETPYTVEFYGSDGLLATLEGVLGPSQADQIDLSDVAELPDGYAGAAVVVAGESSQKGGPALGAVVAEMADAGVNGDVSRGYTGIAVRPLAAQLAEGSIYLPLVVNGGAQ